MQVHYNNTKGSLIKISMIPKSQDIRTNTNISSDQTILDTGETGRW